MGAEASVMVIGPSSILADNDALEYPDDWYDFSENKIVIGHVCDVVTSVGSEALADLCCVDLYDVDNHIVKGVDLVNCDYEELERNGVTRAQIQSLVALTRYPDVTVWFLPNA